MILTIKWGEQLKGQQNTVLIWTYDYGVWLRKNDLLYLVPKTDSFLTIGIFGYFWE